MRFVIDLDSLELIESTTDRRRVTQVEGKRGDDSPFEVIFVRGGVAEELAASTVLTFGAKEEGKYDGTAVVLNDEFALSGTGTSAKYLASPSFNTVALNALFVIDGNDTNDVPYVDLMAEFTWQVGSGAPTSTKTFRFRVHNDVIRGTEGTPLEEPDPEAWLESVRPAPATGSAPINGVLQTELAQLTLPSGSITSNGTVTATITSSLITGSPVTVSINATTGQTEATVRAALEAAITANAAISEKWEVVPYAAGYVFLQAKDDTNANDATMNIAIGGTAGGVTAQPTSTNMAGGVAGTQGQLGQIIIVSVTQIFMCYQVKPHKWVDLV